MISGFINLSSQPQANRPLKVTCTTTDNQAVPVDQSLLLDSETFLQARASQRLSADDPYPDTFFVNTRAHVLHNVVRWLQLFKGLVVTFEVDPKTQVRKWTATAGANPEVRIPNKDWFAGVPIPDLASLLIAADFLNIPSLYHLLCQEFANRITGKHYKLIRRIMQQEDNLIDPEVQAIMDNCPWLPRVSDVHDHLGQAELLVYIPDAILLDIFVLLQRRDLDMLQLVTRQYCTLISLHGALSGLRAPLRHLLKVSMGFTAHRITFPGPQGTPLSMHGFDLQEVYSRMKFSVVDEICINAFHHNPVVLLADAPVAASCIGKIMIHGTFHGDLTGETLLQNAVVKSCNKLDLCLFKFNGYTEMPFPLNPAAIIEWLHQVPDNTPPRWDDVKCINLHGGSVVGGIPVFFDVLNETFKADRVRRSYKIRLCLYEGAYDFAFGLKQIFNERTGELLTIEQDHWSSEDHLVSAGAGIWKIFLVSRFVLP